MTTLNRLRVGWSGSGVTGPGVSTFYFLTTGSGEPTALLALYNALKSRIPNDVLMSVATGGDQIEDTTGALVGAWGTSAVTVVAGGSTNAYLQGTGTRIVWGTGGITGRKRVRGSTFIVPLEATDFTTTGQMLTTANTAITTAAQTFQTATSASFVIWSRPKVGRAGSHNLVTSVSVPFNPTWLLSRRT